MFREEGGKPGDERGFLHKSFIGRAIGGVAKRVLSATPVGQVVSTVGSFALGRLGRRGGPPPPSPAVFTTVRQPARDVLPRELTSRVSGRNVGAEFKFPSEAFAGPGGPCGDPRLVRAPDGHCVARGSGHFRQHFGETAAAVGDALMGQFGAALEPGVMTIERSVCLPGMQLAKDGLCYNKGAITNSQRMWPRGRRPLLTGGDMRAIGIAARAGAKLDRTTKRLRSLGMMKRLPAPRKAAHQHAKPVAAVSV